MGELLELSASGWVCGDGGGGSGSGMNEGKAGDASLGDDAGGGSKLARCRCRSPGTGEVVEM